MIVIHADAERILNDRKTSDEAGIVTIVWCAASTLVTDLYL